MFLFIRSRVLLPIFMSCFALAMSIACRSLFAQDELTEAGIAASAADTVLIPVPAASADGFHHKDRSQFTGARACIDCHRSEYVSWLGSQHYKNSKKNRFEGTESSIDTKYKREVGNLQLCYKCHAAPREQQFGRTLVESGTSCESCHGAAGGQHGWLNRHAVYGPNPTKREHETAEHRAERQAFCDTAGMLRAGRPYEMAKNCFGCHIIADATLVGENVKHPVSFDKFSLIPYMQGEVRHNFHMNQRKNAETPSLDTLRRGLSLQQRKRMYLILEQFAKAEVALIHLAALPSEDAMEDDLAGELIDLFDDAAGEVEDFFDELEEPENNDIPGLSEEQLAPLQMVIDEFEAFDDLKQPTRADAAKSAIQISQAATAFEALHDGSQLKALDEAFIADLADPIGSVLAP